jgi:hypothetical protein
MKIKIVLSENIYGDIQYFQILFVFVGGGGVAWNKNVFLD